MRLSPSDPNIETLISRIKKGLLNLQPDFQRGEVWSYAKKQRLIDTILRDWHVPPIHVIEVEGNKTKEVLDGQQRLVSIRDFVFGEIRVNGFQEPRNPEIEKLHDLTYSRLPEDVKNAFDDYTIRVFTLTDYSPERSRESCSIDSTNPSALPLLSNAMPSLVRLEMK